MHNNIEPKLGTVSQGTPKVKLSGSAESFPGTVRGTVPDQLKDKLEAEQIIRSITRMKHVSDEDSLKRLIVLLLGALALFALTILLLVGLGIITLPTAFLFAVISPLLSGVLALLAALVKRLSR